MSMVRKLISVSMLVLVGSLLLPLVSIAATSGTTYDTPSTTATVPASILERTVSVEVVPLVETTPQSMANGPLRCRLGLSRSLVAAKSTPKGVQLVEDIVGPNAKATLNEAGDLVIESQNGLAKVRFDINRTVPHKSPHAHVEVFEQVKNKKVPVQKSGPIYPKDVPHE